MKALNWAVGSRVPIWILLIATFWIYTVHYVLFLTFPFQVEFGEGSAFVYADRLRQALPLYQDLSQPPFVICRYTPVFFWLSGLLMNVFGFGLWAGRFIAEVSNIAIAGLLVWWGWRRLGPTGGVFCIGFYLINAMVLYWSKLMRVDFLGLLFTLLGLLCCTRQDGKRDIEGAVSFALAFAVKQSFVTAPLAVGLVLLRRDPKRAVKFGAIYAALVIATLLGLNHTTEGMFWHSAFELLGKTTYTVYNWQMLWDMGGAYCLSVLGHLFFAVWFLLRKGWRLEPVIVLYWLLTTVLAVGIVREGGFYNYFLEFHLGLCLVAAAGAAKLYQ